MCGIAGASVLPSEGPRSTLSQRLALKAMRHRGPDAEGSVGLLEPSSGRVAGWVGAARLAILDTSAAGSQPLTDAASRSLIVHNGEVYNHHEIRAALPAREWRSECDTETILHAWLHWGPACLTRLRGMFAFAIWDARDGCLYLARDRLGIKPLYMAECRWGVAFASEVRSLLTIEGVPNRLEPEDLAGYLRFGSVQEPGTLRSGITSLPPATWARIRWGRVESAKSYWDPIEEVRAGAATEGPTDLRIAVECAVSEHLISDVPMACFLSGGIDSTLIAALAARQVAERPVAFTLALDHAARSEVGIAEATARRLGMEHRGVRITADQAVTEVQQAIQAQDLPSADGINTYLVAGAAAREGFRVALSGLGGDELFGGYSFLRRLKQFDRWGAWLQRMPSGVLRAVAGWGDRGWRAVEAATHGGGLAAGYDALRGFWSGHALSGLLARVPSPTAELPGAAELRLGARITLLELRGYLRNTLLRDSDAMSMAHSLELRVPLLDHRVVEYSLRSDAAGATKAKGVLLAACGDLLPREVARRPKQGFLVDMDAWLRGPIHDFAREGLLALEKSGAVPGLNVDATVGDFHRKRLGWTRLWQLAVLGHWLARWN